MISGGLGKVVHVNPQAHTVDLVMLDRKDRISNVPVLAGSISTAAGSLNLPNATEPKTLYDVQDTGKTDVYALVLFIRNLPFVIGFKVPEITQMTFEDGRRIDRHDSDVYDSTDLLGNVEKHWPNGLFWRVGTSPDHEDLTGQDFDGLWNLTKNTSAALYVTLQLPGGLASITIDPQGNMVSSFPNWQHTGQMTVGGSVVSTGNMAAGTGASGSFTTATGQTVTVQDGIITNIF